MKRFKALVTWLVLAVLATDICQARTQKGYELRVMPDPKTGLPIAETSYGAPGATRKNVRGMSVVVKKVEQGTDETDEAWRVQARSSPVTLDSRKAYTWHFYARCNNCSSVNLVLLSYSRKRPVAITEAQFSGKWKRYALRFVQPPANGVYEFQVNMGTSTGTFYFNEFVQSSFDMDRSFLEDIDERIESVRQGTFWVTVADQSGTPVPIMGLNLTLQRHAFQFGAAIEPEVVQKKNAQ